MQIVRYKSILVVLILVLALGMGAGLVGAQEGNDEGSQSSPAESPLVQKSSDKIDYAAMTDMQIALMMINNQIEYLMKQLGEGEESITKLVVDYEERLQSERERHTNQVKSFEDKISQLEDQIQAKEAELKETQESMHQLEKDSAIFISESGLYLKILLGFLVGTVFGVIVGSILHWWKGRGQRPSVAG